MATSSSDQVTDWGYTKGEIAAAFQRLSCHHDYLAVDDDTLAVSGAGTPEPVLHPTLGPEHAHTVLRWCTEQREAL